MSTEHDTEYGPTPPGAQYEHTDIDVVDRLQVRACGCSWHVVLSLGIVYGMFWLFEGQQVE